MEKELPLMETDRQAQVTRSAWVHLGCKARYRNRRLCVVWVQTEKEVLRLVTNLGAGRIAGGRSETPREQSQQYFVWLIARMHLSDMIIGATGGIALEDQTDRIER